MSLVHIYSRSPKKPALQELQKECQIGLHDPAEADLELFCNSWSAGFFGERLYIPIEHLWQVLRMAFVAPHRCLAAGRCLGCVPDAQSTGSLPRSRPNPSENKTACGASCSSVRCFDDTARSGPHGAPKRGWRQRQPRLLLTPSQGPRTSRSMSSQAMCLDILALIDARDDSALLTRSLRLGCAQDAPRN